ncbi:MAG: YlzJ-like family protein [Firmicutes bacterium]|nr:YlzJ-like family protein [Bacillota bacterium]
MLYTVMPVETVMGWDEGDPELVEVEVGGVLMQVLPDGQGGGVVERLLSTDPQDYLKAEFQPGNRVHLPVQ